MGARVHNSTSAVIRNLPLILASGMNGAVGGRLNEDPMSFVFFMAEI